MTPSLIVHIGAGAVAILSGSAALSVHKGDRLHRVFGTTFFLSMLVMSALGVYLAVFGPQPTAGAAPPKASVAVGILTFYLVATSWMSARQQVAGIRSSDLGALSVVIGTVMALLIFGIQAAASAPNQPGRYVPYFVFACFGAFVSILDLMVILRGGISGASRIARHLWRMCFALFLAAAFFFLGQQKIMTGELQGSPVLYLAAFAPLVLMFYFLLQRRQRSRIASGATLSDTI